MKKLLSMALCLSLLLGLLSFASSVSADLSYDSKTEDEIILLVNEERAKLSQQSLKTAPVLNEAARKRAYEISKVFDHVRPDGSSCFTVLKDYAISYKVAGENIAGGYVDAQAVMKGWMNSPSHKGNILYADYTHIGVGVYGKYYVEIFTGYKGSYEGEHYVTPSVEKAKEIIWRSYPFASESQINGIYNELKSKKTTFSYNDLINSASKLNYEFPTVSGDFNGDGKDDVAQFTMNTTNTAQIDVMYSDGSKFTRKNNVWNSGTGWNVSMFTHRMVVGDFNGDKKDDIAAFYDYGKGECRVFVWESTSNGFKLQWNYWHMFSGYYPTRINDRVVAGDFNGDGKDDICAFYDYGKGECRGFVWESTGSNFNMNWNYWYMPSGFDASRLNTRIVTGDYNGDKKDDICAFYDYGNVECRAFVWESGNKKLNLKWNYWYMSSGFTASRLNGRVTAGDYNGDGKDDICAFYDYGKGELRAFVWQSTGSTLKLNWNWWYMKSGFYSDNLTGRVVTGDFNGDKKDDVGAYYCYSAGAEQGKGRMFVYRSVGTEFKLDWNWYLG